MTHWTSNRRIDRSASLPIFFTNYTNERIEETIRNTTSKLVNSETDLLRWDVCDLDEYPIEIRQLQRINRDRNIRISICCNNLTYFSSYLISDSVVELSLQFNKISKIPQSICKMKKLKLLNLSNNCIKSVPAEILCMKLNVLSLENNSFFGEEIVKKLNEKEKMKVKLFRDTEKEKNILGVLNIESEGDNDSSRKKSETFTNEEVKNAGCCAYSNSFSFSNSFRSKLDLKNTKSLENTCKDKINVKDDTKEVYCSVCGNMTDSNLHFYEIICREGINLTLDYVLCSAKCYYEQLNF